MTKLPPNLAPPAVHWQHAIHMMTTPTTPVYAAAFAIAVAETMVGPEEPCPSVDERRSAFAVQVLDLVEEVAEAVRVNALPELRRLPREAGPRVPLGLGRESLGDRMRMKMATLWFLKFKGAPAAFLANLHLIQDSEVSAAVSTLMKQIDGNGDA